MRAAEDSKAAAHATARLADQPLERVGNILFDARVALGEKMANATAKIRSRVRSCCLGHSTTRHADEQERKFHTTSVGKIARLRGAAMELGY